MKKLILVIIAIVVIAMSGCVDSGDVEMSENICPECICDYNSSYEKGYNDGVLRALYQHRVHTV